MENTRESLRCLRQKTKTTTLTNNYCRYKALGTMKTGVPARLVISIALFPSSLKCLANPKSASFICESKLLLKMHQH
jgi:hypothetical protein